MIIWKKIKYMIMILIKIIDEFYLMSPKYCHGLNSLFIRTETEMQFKQDEKQDLVNSFVEKVRRKYWKELFQNKKIYGKN